MSLVLESAQARKDICAILKAVAVIHGSLSAVALRLKKGAKQVFRRNSLYEALDVLHG
jgi:hypothetical protein